MYLYPRVQYRLREGVPQIIGIAEGMAAVAHATSGLDCLDLAGWQYRVLSVDCEESEIELDERDEPRCYSFSSPWLALNQDNYVRYQAASWDERQKLLKRTLIGNILSMCKSFDLVVLQRLEANVDLSPTPVYIKRQKLLGFRGRFSVNFQLGSGLGIGHLVSIGLGEIAAAGTSDNGARCPSGSYKRPECCWRLQAVGRVA